jgi:hypothetical protein
MRPTYLSGALLCLTFLAAACGKQSEGERCDLNSGNLDCDTGLICRSADQLSIADRSRGVALCCPPDGVAPGVDACRAGAELPTELPPEQTPADAGGSTTGTGTPDAATGVPPLTVPDGGA